jgi:hypothetical protein
MVRANEQEGSGSSKNEPPRLFQNYIKKPFPCPAILPINTVNYEQTDQF